MEKKTLDWVLEEYRFPDGPSGPWVFKDRQVDAINGLGLNWNAGHWFEMAVGKTAISTAIALYHRIAEGNITVALMPPILLTQWAKWLRSIKHKDGTPLKVCLLRGTPKQRAAMDLDADFVVVSYQVFKREYQRFTDFFKDKKYSIVLDEAVAVCNVATDTHQMAFDFSLGHPRMLLTGTPMGNVPDAFGLLRFTNPTAYRSQRMFENMHVDEVDFYGKAKTFKNLETLKENLDVNSMRVLFREVHKATDPPLIQKVEYDLSPDHAKLYDRLAENKMLELESGGKVDGTAVNSLHHMLGQIVLNWAHFAEDPKKVAAGIELAEEILHELGDGKLVVFVHYRMTVANLLRHFEDSVSINGDCSPAEKDANLERFKNDPRCRVIFVQTRSGGFGIDGLQYVCNNVLWLEPCSLSRDFAQANARVDRPGQDKRVVVRVAVAAGTNQVSKFDALIANDELVGKVVRNMADLRKIVKGGTL